MDCQTVGFDQVVVVDNGSTDGATELAEQRGARVCHMGSNRGFAIAVNRGIRETSTPLLAILNSDVVLERSWLERLVGAFRSNPSVWFATGKLRSAGNPRVLDGAWDAIGFAAAPLRIGWGQEDGPRFDRSKDIAIAPMTAAVFRTALFDRIGALDDQFESYLEDVDFGIRCAASGYRGCYVANAEATHVGSATLGRWNPKTARKIARNQVYLLAKHFKRATIKRYLWPILAGQILWIGLAARHGAFLAALSGKWAGLRRFQTLRAQTRLPDQVKLLELLNDGESQITSLTRGSLYWRLYHLFTGPWRWLRRSQ